MPVGAPLLRAAQAGPADGAQARDLLRPRRCPACDRLLPVPTPQQGEVGRQDHRPGTVAAGDRVGALWLAAAQDEDTPVPLWVRGDCQEERQDDDGIGAGALHDAGGWRGRGGGVQRGDQARPGQARMG